MDDFFEFLGFKEVMEKQKQAKAENKQRLTVDDLIKNATTFPDLKKHNDRDNK